MLILIENLIMNEKVKALQKLFNLSDEWIRANKKLVSTLIKDGDTPGPGPEPPGPTPTVTIVFKPHNNETGFNVEASAGTTNCTVDSTIEGINVPFTAALKTENDWCTLNIVNNVLQITVTKNLVEEVRSCAIVVTQQELLGEQKTFELGITQAAAQPIAFDFIANNYYMLFGTSDTVMLDYFFTDAPNAEKKNITGGGSPSYILDPKCLKNYNAFGNHSSQYKNSGIKSAVLLGFTKSTSIPSNAFGNNPDLQDVLIPDSCLEVKNDAFKYSGSTNGLRLYFLSSTPPTFAERALLNCTINKIYVPIGAKAAYDAVLSDYTQYIEEINIKLAGGWSNNTAYKYNATLDYNEVVQQSLTFDEIMAYINA